MKITFVFKMLLAMLIATAFLFSCNIEKRWYNGAQKLYARHPDSLSNICARSYPVEDSVAYDRIDSVKPAKNENFTGTIDSLSQAADSLTDRIKRDSMYAKQISVECAELVGLYSKEMVNLRSQVKTLKDRYKPCDPDTMYRSSLIYRKNTAEIASLKFKLSDADKKIATQKNELDEKEKEINKKEAKILKLQKDKLILIVILSAIGLGLGVFAFFKFKTGILGIFK